MKRFLRRHFGTLLSWVNAIRDINRRYVVAKRKSSYKECAESAILEMPFDVYPYSSVHIGPYVKIRKGFIFLGGKGQLYIRKYTVIAMNCTIITDGHKPVLGIPQILAGANHINDRVSDIVIEEAVWIGINCTLLPGTKIGRGAIIGACSVVNKEIPPYAVAVGSPAKVIASAFTLEEILVHEESLYPLEERLTRGQLELIFNEYFIDKKSIGTFPKLNEDEKNQIEQKIHEMQISTINKEKKL